MLNLLTWDFWNSNFAQNLFVLLAGAAALYVYYLNKRAEKRNAARVVLMEIRNAEQLINRLRAERVIHITGSILPTNSWGKYNHLFADVLDQDELDMISDFYSKAEGLEEQRKRVINAIPVSVDEKAKHIQRKLVDMAVEMADLSEKERNEKYEARKKVLIEMTNKEDFIFDANYPKEGLQILGTSINLVSGSVAVARLKRIAKG